MSLDQDRSRFQPQAAARVGMRLAVIGPIDDLQPIYPNSERGPIGDDSFCEPMSIIGIDETRDLPGENPARAAIDWPAAVAILVLMIDLAFVPIHHLVWNTTKKYP